MLLRFTGFLEKFVVEEFKIENPGIENSELNLRVQKSRVEMFCNPYQSQNARPIGLFRFSCQKRRGLRGRRNFRISEYR